MQEEAEASSRSHQARLSELQESFRSKIKELRAVHEEQLSAAIRQAGSSKALEAPRLWPSRHKTVPPRALSLPSL